MLVFPYKSVIKSAIFTKRSIIYIIIKSQIFLSFSPSQSSIASSRSSWLHPVLSQSWYMQVFVSQPLPPPCVGFPLETLLVSSILASPAVPCMSCSFYLDGLWDESLERHCFQDLFKTILIYLSSSFFSIQFISVYVENLWSRRDTVTAWKKSRFILLEKSDFHMID